MSEFVFFELEPGVRREMKLPPHPIPVRRDRQGAVFLPGGRVDFPAMLEEVRAFLDENPELEGDYAHLVAMLAYLSGMDAASRGFHEQALRIYEMGLDAVPGSISLRSHYALSLQCLGRSVEARREIEEVIAATPKDQILPVLWMILARIYARDGEFEKAYWLLKDVSTLIPDEPGFWDFLGEVGEKAGVGPSVAGPVAPAAREEQAFTVNVGALGRGGGGAASVASPAAVAVSAACSRCRTPLVPGSKFCLECGAPAAVAGPAKCARCAAELPPSAKFCLACGTQVGLSFAVASGATPATSAAPKPLACAGCGRALAPGTQFCTECGARAA